MTNIVSEHCFHWAETIYIMQTQAACSEWKKKTINKKNNLHLILISHWLYIKKKRNICNHIFHWL